MKDKDLYIQELEKLIRSELLPIYNKYFEMTGDPKPTLNVPILESNKKLPLLLRRF